jgi:opacity protein-like surface antigen
MKKILSFASLGLASICFQSASAETVETFKPLLLSESAKEALIVAQADESDGLSDSGSEEEPDQRVDGLYFPLAIGGQQFSGFGLSNTINGEDYSGSLNSQFGFSGETGIGYKFGDFRTEVLYGYSDMPGADMIFNGDPRVRNIKASNSNMQTLTFGLLYDINTNSRWTPYVGGTIGAGWLTLGGMSFDVGNVSYSTKQETQAAIVYGGKAGLSYRVSRAWDVYIEGAYQRTGDYNFDLDAKGENRRVVEKDEQVEEEVKVEEKSTIEESKIVTSTVEETVTKDVKETVPGGELFVGTKWTGRYEPDGEGRRKVLCNERFFGVEIFDNFKAYPQCFDAVSYTKITPETFTQKKTIRTLIREPKTVTKDTIVKKDTIIRTDSVVLSKPDFSDLDFGPGDGWSVKVGFRWFFNQPANEPVVAAETVEPAPQPVVEEEQVPVRGLW